METVRADFDDVGVDRVDAVTLVVDYVLPPHVGREGPAVAAPEHSGPDVVALVVPGRGTAGQLGSSEQILWRGFY